MNANARTCAASQSSCPWLQVASAGQVRARQAGNEDLRLTNHASVDHGQRHAGIVDLERLAGAVRPAHHRRTRSLLPSMEVSAELRVPVAVRMLAQILEPEQLHGDAAAAQLLLDDLPVRERPVHIAGVARREQPSGMT